MPSCFSQSSPLGRATALDRNQRGDSMRFPWQTKDEQPDAPVIGKVTREVRHCLDAKTKTFEMTGTQNRWEFRRRSISKGIYEMDINNPQELEELAALVELINNSP